MKRSLAGRLVETRRQEQSCNTSDSATPSLLHKAHLRYSFTTSIRWTNFISEMARQSNTTKLSPLESLPIELKNLIFDRLLDIPSLLAAVLTGPELYHAFKADESRVSRSVLCMQINETSMSDAIGAWVARSHFNKYWTVRRTQKFFHETEDRNESFLKNVNLAKGLQMSQLHSAVQHLALGTIR